MCKKNNLKKVKAIIVMYHGGYPQNAENYINLKKKFGSYIIEDACHALGAEYRVKKKFYKVGSCNHADISTFSLHPLKTITTGEGGVVSCNSKKIYEKIKLYRSLGIKRNPKKHWKYDVVNYGLNFRLNDIQCALGISQLKKINLFLKERKKISNHYKKMLKNIEEIKLPKYEEKNKHSFHLFIVSLEKLTVNKKDNFFKFMLKNNIMLQYHYIPIYKFSNYKKKNFFINTEIFYNKSFSLPIYYGLSKSNQNLVINLIKKYLNKIKYR